MKYNIIGLLILICIILSSVRCIQEKNSYKDSNRKEGKTSITKTIEGEKSVFIGSQDSLIKRIGLSNDTLLVVSRDKNIYFPLGQFKDINALLIAYPFFSRSEIYDSINQQILYKCVFNNSTVRLFLDSEDNKLRVFSADISDSDILLENKIQIGNTKSHVLSKYNISYAPNSLDNIKVIKVVSIINGISIYYLFNRDKLNSIMIRTIYIYN